MPSFPLLFDLAAPRPTTRDIANTVKLGGSPQWVYFTLPTAARTFRNSLDLEVSAAGVRAAGGQVKLAVYEVRATV